MSVSTQSEKWWEWIKSEDDTEEGMTWLGKLAGWPENYNATSALYLYLLNEWVRLLPPL